MRKTASAVVESDEFYTTGRRDDIEIARWLGGWDMAEMPRHIRLDLLPHYLREDAAAITLLPRLVRMGYCPCLVFDDNGSWQLSLDWQGTIGPEGEGWYKAYCVPKRWENTISEAIVTTVLEVIKGT